MKLDDWLSQRSQSCPDRTALVADGAEMTYAEAAKLALQQEMTRDSRVWALGEDLGSIGGIAGQYRGLQEEFGRSRICDTPISESTIMGAAVGAAICGTRPVVDPITNKRSVRPADVRPADVTIPLLYGIAQTVPGLVAAVRPKSA